MSEDCLYLNVWTPAKSPEEKIPVMVVIHGGAFMSGAGSLPLYIGSALAEESSNNTSVNYGLLDQQAALRWAQNNIAAFGGDPARVTLFGESAGAVSVISHLASPQSKGLYSQAIVESGPFLTKGPLVSLLGTRAEAERRGVKFAQSLGYSGEDAVLQMRNRSVWDLINATPGKEVSTFWEYHSIYFTPTINGWLLPYAPEEIFRQGREDPVPLIIGNNADEGQSFIAGINMTVPEYEQYIRDY